MEVTQEEREVPKIFISYSWTTKEHEEWVLSLSMRLSSDGIHVVLDKWDLKDGHDTYHFMETSVKSHDIKKVLIILDEGYSRKANQRSGGVGTEAMIISPTIYKDVANEKFIPIIAERDQNGKPFIPTFLDGRKYIDLSQDENFESEYEKLLRNIFNRPELSRPKLGSAPKYIFENSPITYKTAYDLRSFDYRISKNPRIINSLIETFFSQLLTDLKAFELNISTRDKIEFGRIVVGSINSYTPLRDNFVVFIDKITSRGFPYEFDYSEVVRFFERLPTLSIPSVKRSYLNAEYDNIEFMIYELFLYTISIGLKNENYNFLEEMLSAGYYVKLENRYKAEFNNYQLFYSKITSINDFYQDTYKTRYINPVADLIIKRIPSSFSKNIIINGDLLCHYISKFKNLSWFPQTYIYNDEPSELEIFTRLNSLKHFNKVKGLFGISEIAEFKEKVNKIINDEKGNPTRYMGSMKDSVDPLESIIDINKVGTIR